MEEEVDQELEEELEVELKDLEELNIADELEDLGRLSAEPLNVKQMWIKRLEHRRHEKDTKLWKGRAFGGSKDDPDALLELIDKDEADFVELRCTLVNTREAPDVIAEAEAQLEALKSRFRGRKYARALGGMVQAVLKEQEMGFKTNPHSKWNFDEKSVNPSYRIVLQKEYCPSTVSDAEIDWAIKAIAKEVERVDAGDYLHQIV